MYWLPKIICNMFYHRFGFKSDRCARCGIDMNKADGMVIDSEYDK